MNFVDRPYEEIVVDVLTTLTAGIAQEVHRVDYDADARPPVPVTVTLLRRPVRRVSLVRGFLPNPDPQGEPIARVFQLDDFELAAGPEDPTDFSVLRFIRPDRRPAPGTDLTINYFPATSEPTPITDVNVGSVARTIVEAISLEMAQLYEQLNQAYDSGFLETATGSALDRVVALVAQKRARAGVPVGIVRFSRRSGSVGIISIPVGTPVTDVLDTARYETVEPRQMLAGESTAEVRVRGATPAVPAVEANTLTVAQRAIAGVDSVTNPRPTTRATSDEADEDLRRRAAGALLATNKGTVSALENGLLALPDVRSVSITEEPNGLPGEIAISLDVENLAAGDPLPPVVINTIDELRVAGIRVTTGLAARTEVAVRVALVLAGAPQADSAVTAIQEDVKKILDAQINRLGVTGKVRNGPLIGAILADTRIVDARITLSVKGETAADIGADLAISPQAAVIITPSDVAFDATQFDQPAADGGATTATASLVIRAVPDAGSTLAAVEAEIKSRFETFVAAIRPGDTLEHSAILSAFGAASEFTVDPDSAIITLTAGDLFVELVSTGSDFAVPSGLSFVTGPVDVTA